MLTADAHGQQAANDRRLGFEAVRISASNETAAKGDYVRELNPQRVVAIGQGANDAEMLREAMIGICLLSPEGLAVETLLSAGVIAQDIHNALALRENPMRLVASLRR
jgi:soluble P-type ATPase